MMKNTKRLLLAVALVAVGSVLVLTGTYAWFSASQSAKAEGLQLTATAPNNLLISADDSTWGNTATLSSDTSRVLPVSSVSGCNDTFFVPKSAANGVLTSTGTVNATRITDPGAGNGAAYYVDIPLYLKLDSTDDAAMASIRVSSVQVTSQSGDAGVDLSAAYRVAVFDGSSADASGDTQIYFGGNELTGDAVYPIASATSLASEQTNVFSRIVYVTNTSIPLTVRIWLEGQDPACVDANAADTVSVSIAFASASEG